MDNILNKIFLKFYLGVSEIMGIIIGVILTAISGLLLILTKKYLFLLLEKLGINYFSNRLKTIKDINRDLLFCQGRFNANIYGLFRTYNGRSYVEENTFSITDSDAIKFHKPEKIIVRKMNSNPDNFFPEFLDKELYKSIISLSVVNDWKVFSYDSLKEDTVNSPLLVFFESVDIDYLMTFRIWDKNKKTYGLIFFAWKSKPDMDNLFTRDISRKLDSIAIRFQTYIEGSILEKIGIRF